MNFDDSLRNELSLLILLSVEGKINQEGFDRLAYLLKSTPHARNSYFSILDVHLGLNDIEVQSEFHEEGLPVGFNPAVLEALAEYERIAPMKPAAVPQPAPVELITKVHREKTHTINKASLAVVILSLAAMLLLIAFVYFLPPKTDGAVGRLNRATGAKWATVNGMLEPGSDLYPGPMHLLEGAAEITLDSGAALILEAPALLELETPSRIFLNRGRLVATAQTSLENRFVVRTPFSTVVDFGTEFGVQVDSSRTQTRVFRGQVELRSGVDPLKYLSAMTLNVDQAGAVNANGDVSRVEIMPQTFMRRQQFETMELAARGDPFYRWKAFNDQLHRDPSLVAHYTFEQNTGSENTLVNLAPKTTASLNGTLGVEGNQPQWIQGRWPLKQALRFEREKNQRVVVASKRDLSIAGPLTLVTWIYLEPGDHSGHLLSSRGLNHVNYQFGWMGDDHPDTPRRNKIQLLRYTQDRTQRGYSSAVALKPGVWHCLAATHDNQVAQFYLDGTFLSEVQDAFHAEAAAVDLVIGDVPFEGSEKWRFDGTVDEIIVLNRVMTPAEMLAVYQAGKP